MFMAEPERFELLDGWRGISIALVMAAHLLPLGPRSWELNAVSGVLGMAIFFILSGFLITSLLLKRPPITHFLIRRIFRIAPLAVLTVLILYCAGRMDAEQLLRQISFTSNLRLPAPLLSEHTGHFWSLSLEVQFYIFIALLVMIFRDRAFVLLPLLALAVTANRIAQGAHVDITTLLRVDEILAGATLALLYARHKAGKQTFIFPVGPAWGVLILVISCHPKSGWLNYARPYLAMWVIGSSMIHGVGPLRTLFSSTPLQYLAQTSYALYVIHGVLIDTWLGTGERLEKYIKRPLLFAATFLLAHFSTFYFENRFIALGKNLIRSKNKPVSEHRK
jgi:peptidoglycan/LPS O-acetylase OafA/YrhL